METHRRRASQVTRQKSVGMEGAWPFRNTLTRASGMPPCRLPGGIPPGRRQGGMPPVVFLLSLDNRLGRGGQSY